MFTFIFLSLLFLTSPILSEDKATGIIKKLESTLWGEKSSSGRIKIIIKKPRFKRTMELESWENRKEKKTFIRILKPDKDRGITFLKWKNELWQYLPSIGKEIKVEGSLMQDSWMGSDFSNDDLVRSSSITEDYFQSIQKEDKDIYEILLLPRPGAPVTWKKILYKIRKSDLMPLRQEFYDHRENLVRIQKFSSYKKMNGRLIPSLMQMESLKANGKEKSRTIMILKDMKFNQNIDSSVFSKANLRK
ncbi:MAG: outer membrane lipoprotein-sorting protein [Leptospiraceae bacterium]|nr:outer membrane lipoprotein-sorting protein [Leptospiraceae bacterium]MCP5503307.1 outer membrane lipoprotein-sorting protein [Leptospiraceae bacterium]